MIQRERRSEGFHLSNALELERKVKRERERDGDRYFEANPVSCPRITASLNCRKGFLKRDKSRFIEIRALGNSRRGRGRDRRRFPMISAATRGNVLGCGNYRKSLSFDLVTPCSIKRPTINLLLLLLLLDSRLRFKNSPLPSRRFLRRKKQPVSLAPLFISSKREKCLKSGSSDERMAQSVDGKLLDRRFISLGRRFNDGEDERLEGRSR